MKKIFAVIKLYWREGAVIAMFLYLNAGIIEANKNAEYAYDSASEAATQARNAYNSADKASSYASDASSYASEAADNASYCAYLYQ